MKNSRFIIVPSLAITALALAIVATVLAVTPVQAASGSRPDRAFIVQKSVVTDGYKVVSGQSVYKAPCSASLYNYSTKKSSPSKRVLPGRTFSVRIPVARGRSMVALRSLCRGQSISSIVDKSPAVRGVKKLVDVKEPTVATAGTTVWITNPFKKSHVANVGLRRGGRMVWKAFGTVRARGKIVLKTAGIKRGEIAEISVVLARGRHKGNLLPLGQVSRP